MRESLVLFVKVKGAAQEQPWHYSVPMERMDSSSATNLRQTTCGVGIYQISYSCATESSQHKKIVAILYPYMTQNTARAQLSYAVCLMQQVQSRGFCETSVEIWMRLSLAGSEA